jgi:hypothetical protein
MVVDTKMLYSFALGGEYRIINPDSDLNINQAIATLTVSFGSAIEDIPVYVQWTSQRGLRVTNNTIRTSNISVNPDTYYRQGIPLVHSKPTAMLGLRILNNDLVLINPFIDWEAR